MPEILFPQPGRVSDIYRTDTYRYELRPVQSARLADMSPAERRRALNAGAVVIRFTEYISLLIDLHRTTGHAEDVPHSFGWLRGTRSGYPAMA